MSSHDWKLFILQPGNVQLSDQKIDSILTELGGCWCNWNAAGNQDIVYVYQVNFSNAVSLPESGRVNGFSYRARIDDAPNLEDELVFF